ncbi:hypothetical protein STAQ_18060 [Allostella sp. ATCC 35155]|nr:hypothetical protein STAQ_18060 [Stella sp. ATCC 35155]
MPKGFRPPLGRWLAAAAILLGSGLAGEAAARCRAPDPSFGFGVNFTHTGLDRQALARCTAKARMTAVSPAQNVVLNYGDAGMRRRARVEFAEMAEAGASSLRLLVWYSPVPRSDRVGTIHAGPGGLPPKLLENLQRYVDDAGEAGFRRIILALGPLGRGSPGCGRRTPGDCFDPASIETSWAVARQLAERLRVPAGLERWIDLGNEICFSTNDRPSVFHNSQAYLTGMLDRFGRTFRSVPFTVSCGGSTARQMDMRLRGLRLALDRTGTRPVAIDVHAYAEDATLPAVLKAAERHAEELDLPLAVTEAAVSSAAFANVRTLRREGALPRLSEFMAWPKRVGSDCGMELSGSETARAMAKGFCPE